MKKDSNLNQLHLFHRKESPFLSTQVVARLLVYFCQYYLLAYRSFVVDQGIRLAQIEVYSCLGSIIPTGTNPQCMARRQTVYKDMFQ